jgi:hypothetical protein
VQQIKVDRGISFVEARKIVNTGGERGSTLQGRTAAAVVASRNPESRQSTRQTTLTTTRQTTRSVEVQTVITWPIEQESPAFLPTSTRVVSSQTITSCVPTAKDDATAEESSSQFISPKPKRSGQRRDTNKQSSKPDQKSNEKQRPRLSRPPGPNDNAASVNNPYDTLGDMEDEEYTEEFDNR